jgi:hypothetical protein
MKNRILLALGMTCVFTGWATAQAPDDAAAAPPPPQPASSTSQPEAPHVADFLGTGPTRERFWMTGEYLMTWVRGQRLPVLVTTSPAGTPSSSAGVLGQPGTSAVIGGDVVDDTLRSGARFGIGCWLLAEHFLGVESSFTYVGGETSSFTAASSGIPILARPFFDFNSSTPQSNLIAFPGNSSGSVVIRSSSGNFYGANVDFSQQLLDTGWSRYTLLLGYRFFRYDEGLRIQQNIAPSSGNFVPGTQLDSTDSFTTENQFHGVDVGLRSECFWHNVSAEVLAKLAVGNLGSTVKIDGSQVVSVPGTTPLIQSGGFYALASNIGNHTDDEWTVLPEVGLTLRWRPTDHLQLSLGYSLLWLNQVARAPDQIDMSINRNLLPPATQSPSPTGTDHPAFLISRTDVWLQSIVFGVSFRY